MAKKKPTQTRSTNQAGSTSAATTLLGGDRSKYRPTYPDSPFIHVADIVDQNSGKTYRELNAEKTHKIPIGTLVEVKFDTWFGDGACWKVHARLWVVKHTRDCDRTPLYSLSRWKDPETAERFLNWYHGMGEEQLTPIEVTKDLVDGVDALEWPEST